MAVQDLKEQIVRLPEQPGFGLPPLGGVPPLGGGATSPAQPAPPANDLSKPPSFK